MDILKKLHMKEAERNYVEHGASSVKLEKSNYVHIEVE